MNSLTSCALRVTRIATLLLLGAVQASAEESPSDCSLRVASGPKDKVYGKMVEDMESVCGAAVSVCAVPSTGGLQNLSLLSANSADLGIVQIDTLQEMSAGDENYSSASGKSRTDLSLKLRSPSRIGTRSLRPILIAAITGRFARIWRSRSATTICKSGGIGEIKLSSGNSIERGKSDRPSLRLIMYS